MKTECIGTLETIDSKSKHNRGKKSPYFMVKDRFIKKK